MRFAESVRENPIPPSLARGAIAVLCLLGACVAAAPLPESPQGGYRRSALPDAPAMRVVTLAPSLTELVFAAGAGDKLAGVSAYSDFPASARQLPQVASAAGISWESLLALKPDLVLAWKGGTRPADMARLKELGVNVLAIEVEQLDDVPRALRAIGERVGRRVSASSAADLFQRKVNALREANAGKPVVKTFFEISSKPLMTVGGRHVISEMIRLCGGANVLDDAPGLVSEPSREEVLARGPDAVLFGCAPGQSLPANTAVYAGLRAALDGRLYGITADYAFRPGPRLLLATEEICDALDQSRASMKEKSRH